MQTTRTVTSLQKVTTTSFRIISPITQCPAALSCTRLCNRLLASINMSTLKMAFNNTHCINLLMLSTVPWDVQTKKTTSQIARLPDLPEEFPEKPATRSVFCNCLSPRLHRPALSTTNALRLSPHGSIDLHWEHAWLCNSDPNGFIDRHWEPSCGSE